MTLYIKAKKKTSYSFVCVLLKNRAFKMKYQICFLLVLVGCFSGFSSAMDGAGASGSNDDGSYYVNGEDRSYPPVQWVNFIKCPMENNSNYYELTIHSSDHMVLIECEDGVKNYISTRYEVNGHLCLLSDKLANYIDKPVKITVLEKTRNISIKEVILNPYVAGLLLAEQQGSYSQGYDQRHDSFWLLKRSDNEDVAEGVAGAETAGGYDQ